MNEEIKPMHSESNMQDATPILLLQRKWIAAVIVFAAGYLITTIWVYAAGYPQLPFKGVVVVADNGDHVFSPYYPKFHRYAITEGPTDAGTESLFSRSGFLLTGAFFYIVTNAPHWSFELNISNLRGLVAVPLLVILIGCFVLYRKLIPAEKQTPEQAVQFGVGIGLLHSVLVIAVLLLGNLVSSSFAELFSRPNFYGGQFAGTILPGTTVIVLTGLFYGAISGSLLSAYMRIQSSLASLSKAGQKHASSS